MNLSDAPTAQSLAERDAELEYELKNFDPHRGPPKRVGLRCGCRYEVWSREPFIGELSACPEHSNAD